MRRLVANPVLQFLAVGLLVLVAVLIGSARLSQRAADTEAIVDARTTTRLLARLVAQPAIPRGLVKGDPGAVDRFDRTALRRLLVGDVKRVKIWRRDGQIVYSDKTQLIGQRYALGDDETAVLDRGSSDAEISDLTRPENRFERGFGSDLLEVYTRLRSPEGDPLLFELYFSANDIAQRKDEVYSAFRPITVGGLLALVLLTTPFLWVLTRRLDRIGRDRQRLLEAARDASDYERRRIARDLHDGVVQDLAGTAFALSATARDPGTEPNTAQRLEPMSDALRSSLRSLRSLLVEIYPPELDSDGISAALNDLVAPAANAGVRSLVEVYDVQDASDDSVRLAWRVAQEAVRNVLRHAHATEVTVQLRAVDDRLLLDVSDDGIGFAQVHSAGATGGLGLRALRDLIREAGGRLDVRSHPGVGTTVHLEVAQ